MFWVGLVNRMHGRAWPECLLRTLMLGCVVVWMLLVGGFLWSVFTAKPHAEAPTTLLRGWFERPGWFWQGYLLFCWIVAGVNLWAWLWRHVLHRPTKILVAQTVQSIPLPTAILSDPEHHPMVRLPKNEILTFRFIRRQLELPHLPRELDGLTVLHLSDLHFTGRVAQSWFREIISFCSELQPDLVALTGDFLDTMDCLEWIDEVLSPLQGRLGVYFVLGNHDWRLDWPQIRAKISQMGFVSLAARWTEVVVPVSQGRFAWKATPLEPASPTWGESPPVEARPLGPQEVQVAEKRLSPHGASAGQNPEMGCARPSQQGVCSNISLPDSIHKEKACVGRILLAGNELPWIGPAPEMGSAPPPVCEGGPVRILLAHSPDQLHWAQKNHFDLMLAGHTHGGQIRIPALGAILTPSRMGVRYSEGVFHEPPTVMHVSRGLSAEWPLRWNCPPEVALLVLHPPSSHAAADPMSLI